MTKTEFLNYIESFNKKPGNYTDEEILSICIEHRGLMKADKNWGALASLLGTQTTGEGLRNWTLRHLGDKKQTTCETPTTDETAYAKNYKEHQRIRDEWTNYRKTLRDDARIESLKDAIRDTVGKLNALPDIKASKVSSGDNEAILLLSDMHIGVDCSNYVNYYDTSVASARLSRLATYVKEYCKLNNVGILHVLNLGDQISGIIHQTMRIQNTLDVVEQIMTASELISKFLNDVSSGVSIDYRSVTDNHARAVANKEEAIEKENFNRLIDWYLEERLKGSKIKFIHDNIDAGIGHLTLKNGKYCIFAHGHQDSPAQSFQHMVGLTKRFVDYVLLAHYHSPKQKEYQSTTVIVNGSIVGTDEYAFGKRLFGKPSQKLLVFRDSNLINIDIDLSLEEDE